MPVIDLGVCRKRGNAIMGMLRYLQHPTAPRAARRSNRSTRATTWPARAGAILRVRAVANTQHVLTVVVTF